MRRREADNSSHRSRKSFRALLLLEAMLNTLE